MHSVCYHRSNICYTFVSSCYCCTNKPKPQEQMKRFLFKYIFLKSYYSKAIFIHILESLQCMPFLTRSSKHKLLEIILCRLLSTKVKDNKKNSHYVSFSLHSINANIQTKKISIQKLVF